MPSLYRAQNVPARITIASLAAIATAAALLTLPLSLDSKIPQIRPNARAGSMKQLSIVAVGAPIVGCLARLFTAATEVRDSLVAPGFALALALNMVLQFQMWIYWGKYKREVVSEREEVLLGKPRLGRSGSEKVGTSTKVEVVVPTHSPNPKSSTPTARKWFRKVD